MLLILISVLIIKVFCSLMLVVSDVPGLVYSN